MNRLTEEGKLGWQLIAGWMSVRGDVKAYNKAVEKLAEYEDTGLNPEQIMEMDKLYLEKCEEVNKLLAKLREQRRVNNE